MGRREWGMKGRGAREGWPSGNRRCKREVKGGNPKHTYALRTLSHCVEGLAPLLGGIIYTNSLNGFAEIITNQL